MPRFIKSASEKVGLPPGTLVHIYALMDAMVDSYFIVLQKLGENWDSISREKDGCNIYRRLYVRHL